MGLLRLLTFPVSGPLSGGRWVLRTLLEEAERRHYDEEDIRNALADVQREYEAGLIDEHTLERREEALLERMLEAREYHRGKREAQESQ
jgi:hypothetical protein